MRLLTIIFLILSTLGVSAQETFNLKGTVIDAETQEPLPFATIYYPKKQIGTNSDEAGQFNFYIPSGSDQDEIIISFVGFQKQRIKIGEFEQGKRYALAPNITALGAVTVTAKSKGLKPKDELRKAVKNYRKNRNKSTHIAYAQYREAAFKDDELIMFTEALGYAVYAETKGNWAPYAKYKFMNEETRAYITNPRWMDYGSNQPGASNRGVQPSGSSLLRTLRVLEENGLFSNAKLKKYTVSMDSSYFLGNTEFLKLRFESTFDKGTIHINILNYHIAEIDYQTKGYFSNPIFKTLSAKINLRFNYLEGVPYLSSGQSVYERSGLRHINEIEMLVQKNADVGIDKDVLAVINEYALNPVVVYNASSWSDDEVVLDPKLCPNCGAISPTDLAPYFSSVSGQTIVNGKEGDHLLYSGSYQIIKSLLEILK